MSKANVTRGFGLLESFLAKKRIKMADSLIDPSDRSGRILDIGCGTYPLFLLNTDFTEKYGLEKSIVSADEDTLKENKIIIKDFDIEKEDRLPFEDDYFQIITMLAVFEHIEPVKLPYVLNEIHRILKPGGKYIMTTPAVWTDAILKVMAALRLVSKSEIDEHKDSYGRKKILKIVKATHFDDGLEINFGYFEMFMNLWAVIRKPV